MADPFLGEIRAFAINKTPRDWAPCSGQLLSISDYPALFGLLGTTYGGDGRVTFGLPNLTGRVAVGDGHGEGLTPRRRRDWGGTEALPMTEATLASHRHTRRGTSTTGTIREPSGAMFANLRKSVYRKEAGGTGTVTVRSDDANEDPYTFQVRGTGTAAPEIDVQRPGVTSIADGGTDAQGSKVAGAQVTLIYSVHNNGTAAINVANITSTNASNVSVDSISPTNFTVPSGGGAATFDVRYTPNAWGAFGFELDIANDDGDENPYDVTVSGTVTDKGDISGDGVVDIIDARLCLQIAKGVLPGTSDQRAAADVDNDGDVDMDDAIAIAEFIIGIRTTLP